MDASAEDALYKFDKRWNSPTVTNYIAARARSSFRARPWRAVSIGGSVVECSPATLAARVRFPADANNYFRWPALMGLGPSGSAILLS